MERSRRVNVETLVHRQLAMWEAQARARELHPNPDRPAEPLEVALGPFVAISREIGAGGGELAAALGKRLGWTVYDREIVDFIAERAHVRAHAVKSLGETWHNDVQNWLSVLLDKGFLSSDEYVRYLVEVVTTIARQEPAIFLGRGVSFILPPSRGIRVRVVAPIGQRIAAAVKSYEGMDATKARKLIVQSDAARLSFVRAYFDVDSRDALHHDLVLNTERVSADAGVEACLAVLRDRVGEPPVVKARQGAKAKAGS